MLWRVCHAGKPSRWAFQHGDVSYATKDVGGSDAIEANP